MNERDLIITIKGVVARGTARPVAVEWQVRAAADEPADETGRAITEACRQLNSALKEAVK
jgi:hypothetical protein